MCWKPAGFLYYFQHMTTRKTNHIPLQAVTKGIEKTFVLWGHKLFGVSSQQLTKMLFQKAGKFVLPD